MDATDATPVQRTQFSRFTAGGSWELTDMAVDSTRVAVCGYNGDTRTTSIDLFAFNDLTPSLQYQREFPPFGDSIWRRCVSLFDGDSSHIVTVYRSQLDLMNIHSNVSDDHRTVTYRGGASCVAVSERDIYIGLDSNEVIVFDDKLNIIKSITLNGLEGHWPEDITVNKNNLFISTAFGRAQRYNMDGELLKEYNAPDQYGSLALSITVSSESGLVFVLWEWHIRPVVGVFSLSEDHKLFAFNVDVVDHFPRPIIRTLNANRLISATMKGQLTVYNTSEIFRNFEKLKRRLAEVLSSNECQQLGKFFQLSREQLDVVINSQSPVKDLFNVLEESGVVYPANINRLLQAFYQLEINDEAVSYAEFYKKWRGEETPYERFVAALSSHLTLSLPARLCDFFKFTDEEKDKVTSSRSPGLTFLTVLDEMGIIHQLDVSTLVAPLRELQLVQAVAKVEAYQSLVEESKQMKKTPVNTLEGKETFFIECLRKKIKNWYDSMTPIPWKKSCKWTSSELFVTCRLILTGSKSKLKVGNIDPDCKLQYRDIFTHDRLKSETRIIIEGDPGSGKTMLSSQLAYDWSIGNISDANMVIFLPLRFVEDMTIIEAIQKFYLPSDQTLSADDIQSLLNHTTKAYLVLDGYEEYNGKTQDGKPSEVVSVMKKEKLPNCSVVLTSRSDFVHDLPECPMLRLGQFDEEERDLYLSNIFAVNSRKKKGKSKVKKSKKGNQETATTVIKNSAFLQDLCSSPLLFVFVVHNVEHFVQFQSSGQRESIGAFMQVLVNALFFQAKLDNREGKEDDMDSAEISKMAFNGLCKGHQQLLWQKSFLDRTLSHTKEWVDSGILVVEEALMVGGELPVVEGGLMIEGEPPENNKVDTKEDFSTSETEDVPSGQEEHHALPSASGIKREPFQPDSKELPPSQVHQKLANASHLRNISLQIKFLHKVIQEWFAAIHLSSILKLSKDENRHREVLKRHLPLINPADLHYVLRFTSYLCPDSCHLIMKHLHTVYKQEDRAIPEYILNCIFLCFAEVNTSGICKRMDKVVKQICKNTVTIRDEDSRLLKQSKVAMLNYASISKIHIGFLKLDNVIVMATETQLTFNSDLNLPCLSTLKSIEVSRWDQKLKEEDYKDLVRFIFKLKLLKEARFLFPSPPPSFTDKKELSSMRKDLLVEWIIGERLIHTLDKKTGNWKIEFRKPASLPKEPDKMATHLMVNENGGVMSVPFTGVELEIPPGALREDTLIRMRIIPHYFQDDKPLSFGSNSSVVVELLPSKLKLLKPTKLTLPHCLVLKKGVTGTAKVYSSHHEEGKPPQWKEEKSSCSKLHVKTCVIWLQNFSWKKIEVGDGEFIEAKEILLYAARRMSSTEKTVYVDVGYCLDLPRALEDAIPKEPEEKLLLHHCPASFYRDGRLPLKILFEETKPTTWQCKDTRKNKEISFIEFVSRKSRFRPFVFGKVDPKAGEDCTCYFRIGQEGTLQDFVFPLQPSKAKSPNESTKTEKPQPEKRKYDHQSSISSQRATSDPAVVDDDTLRNISAKVLVKEWRKLGGHLQLQDPELDSIRVDYAGEGQAEVVYQMLITWKRRKGSDATVRILGDAFIKAGRRDLQEILCKQEAT